MNNSNAGKVKGIGSIRRVRDSNGQFRKRTWQVVVNLGYDPITNKQRQITRTVKGTKVRAQKVLEELKRELESGLRYDAEKITFEEYSNQWLKARKESGRLSTSTIKRNTQIGRVLNSYIGSVPVRDIDAPVVRNLYIELYKRGLKETTVNKYSVQLKQIMEQAVRDNLILRNPCQLVDSPRQIKSNIGRALSPEELQRLLQRLSNFENRVYPHEGIAQQKATANKCHCAAIRLILATGLRRGEALGLSWKHIDLKNREIHIRCALDSDNKPKDPKTQNSIRDISIDAATATMLGMWRQQQMNYLNSLGIEPGNETPVFTSEAGDYIDGHNFARWWRLFKKGTEFEDLRIHDLRHTHATMLVTSGLNLKAISARLGHANIGITLDLYSHAQKGDDIKAAQIIGELLQA